MILGLGDCNLRGANTFTGETYLQIVSRELNEKIINCGITMSTTREGVVLFDKNKHHNPTLTIVAYGLVDSWKTFKYSPYVLYYPDNFFRKIARKFVKKYKKIARNLKLNKTLGEKYVVNKKEYEKNILYIINNSKKVILIETPPHKKEPSRNKDIQKYNRILYNISKKYNNVQIVQIYDDFLYNNNFYLNYKNDGVHISQKGYKFIAKKILELI